MKRMVSDVKSEKLAQELTDLETRGDDKLKGRWRSLYGTEAPQKIHDVPQFHALRGLAP